MLTLDSLNTEELEIRYQPPTGIGSIDWLRKAHQEQLDLCRELEEIADSLPNEINRQKCIYAAKAIGPLTRGVHQFEENVLFPWIEEHTKSHPEMAATLERLKFEHCEDECFAEELIDALQRLGSGDPNMSPNAIGYMLRGFFVGVRRHVAFEQEHLVSLVNAPEGTRLI